ncbi:MAG: amidohydrolase family protein [Lautropia sp.]
MPAEPGPEVLGVRHTPPIFSVPSGACDCHVHIFESPERFPFSARRVFTPAVATVADLRARQAALGLDRAVIVQPSPYGTDNRCLAESLRTLGKRARGIAVIDHDTSDAELEELHALGVRGVRINLETVGQRDPALARDALEYAARRVGPLGWHVQVYTHLDVIAALRDVLPNLAAPVMIDHYGRASAALGTTQPGFAELLELLRSGRLYIKLSAPHRISSHPAFADVAEIVSAFIEAAPDHAVWASDWPHGGAWPGVRRSPDVIEPFHPIDDGSALNHLHGWLSGEQLRKVLVVNPARIYGF